MSSSTAASTGPWLPVMPIAVRVAPGIGCALYPISSILRQTSRICASVAPAFINTSIERSLSAGFLPDESMQIPGPAQVVHHVRSQGLGKVVNPLENEQMIN